MARQPRYLTYEDVRNGRKVTAEGKNDARKMLRLSYRECRDYLNIVR